ncbi:type II toxin-antitoxin system Phd/YefM family antitoxin [Brevundimonas sp.]|uniref:type II toxin-antitoxin system Phd/YefM family antitoxin n=1 Tax=Brevundimonas sp. TaxID=1871086 RepID=UPI003566DEBF
MREVGILEAKTGLSGLVAEVERTGEGIVLTRHGRAAAKIVPISQIPQRDPQTWRQVVEGILARRDAQPVVAGFDDLSWDELKRIARGDDRYD